MKNLAKKIAAARDPEKLFGAISGNPSEMRRRLRAAYREMQLVVHPDRNAGSAEAQAATASLNALYVLAVKKIKAGTWGKDDGVTIVFSQAGKPSRLIQVEPFTQGDLCNLYSAVREPGAQKVIIKVARAVADAGLLANESCTLIKLWAAATGGKDVTFSRYLPELVASIKIDGKTANVIKREEGCHTLAEVIAAHPNGLDERHVAWMLRRLLEITAWVHRQGHVHGAILPSNVLVFPRDHRAVLLDWTASAPVDQPVKIMVAKMTDCYPPEATAKRATGAAFDVYMLGKLAMRLLYGSNQRMRPVSPLFLGPLRAATLADPARRCADAFELYQQFDTNIRKLFGAPKFIEFAMP